jgi:hypothetical protein
MGVDMAESRRVADNVGYVHVGGQAFGPGDEIPAELQGEVRNPAVWADGDGTAEVDAPVEADAPVSGAADASDKKAAPPSRGGSRK